MRRLCVLVWLVGACAALPAAAQQPRPGQRLVAVDDLYRLDAPTAPALSPDGKRVAFVRQWVDGTRKVERSSLWLADGGREKARPLEADEPDARAPVWSPDGRWIAFLSTRPRPDGWKQTPAAPPESDPATDVWLVPADGGPAVPLAGPDKPYGRVFNDGFYGRLSFSPDGKRLAFVADDGKDPRSPEEVANDVVVVRPDQGEGYTGYGAAQVWVAQLDEKPGKSAAGKVERLTDDDVWYGDPQWSPDGKALVVHANRSDDREAVRYSINKDFDLWALDVATRKLRRLTNGPGPEVSPRFTPDGKHIVCLTVPRKGSHRDVFNVAVVEWAADEHKMTVLFDHHGKDAGKAPHPAPSFPLPADCWDGDRLVYNAEAGTATRTVRLDLATGKGEELSTEGMKDDPTREPRTAAERLLRRQALVPPGNVFLKERALAKAKVIRWKADDGKEVEGILTLPPEEAGRKAPYPLVVNPHGGPHSRWALGFDFTALVLADNGYAVFQPNFRGSSGYGQEFIDADRFDLGGGDMNDILSGLDDLVRQGVADRGRLFVYGVSYGGFMTSWLVGQTDRFKAAVAQNAVTDLDMMWDLSDLPSWTEWEFGGRPWEVPERIRKHSPVAYADKVKTPTLILHSRDDRRCPLPMGRAFYQALRANKVPTEMVIYPGEGHGIRQPRHREDVLRRVLEWFAKYDKP
jgi:dipeptidyl aminopeptidase/acylaminoacyl peptidase